MTEIEKQEIIKFVLYLKSKVDDFYIDEVESMTTLFFNKLNISYLKDES